MKRELTAWCYELVAGSDSRSAARAGELLALVERYEAALVEIVQRPDDHRRLMEHREATGEGVSDLARGRWFGYLKAAHIAAAALGLAVPTLHCSDGAEE